MAFVIREASAGKSLIVAGCHYRQLDDAASRRQAKIVLQTALSRNWATGSSGNLPLRYSYSHLADQTWAAVTDQNCRIGIDAASDSEFDNAYPLHKVFHDEEIATGQPARIWSAKEAVAKALGCGFDAMNPRDIRVQDFATAIVAESVVLRVWSQQQPDGVWIAVAYEK